MQIHSFELIGTDPYEAWNLIRNEIGSNGMVLKTWGRDRPKKKVFRARAIRNSIEINADVGECADIVELSGSRTIGFSEFECIFEKYTSYIRRRLNRAEMKACGMNSSYILTLIYFLYTTGGRTE